jgi:hypothetical protein
MRKRLMMTACFAALLVIPQAVSAAPAGPAAAPCGAGWNCWWAGTNFTGPESSRQDLRPPGSCASAPGSIVRSYAFYGGQEGYFFQSNNCTGPSRAVVANSESADLGFDAYSFKSACVSCKSPVS